MHFQCRRGRVEATHAAWPKLTAVLHTASQLIVGTVAACGPIQDSLEFPTAVRQAAVNLRPRRPLGDKGYDADHNQSCALPPRTWDSQRGHPAQFTKRFRSTQGVLSPDDVRPLSQLAVSSSRPSRKRLLPTPTSTRFRAHCTGRAKSIQRTPNPHLDSQHYGSGQSSLNVYNRATDCRSGTVSARQ
jgi:hypothetical protein